ncbi:MAG: glycogen synthase GlgA [Verrucomicrobiota bacterium]|nr:glycogen synthase GlgA [Verrucomicrobiota bacterium]
MRVLLASSEVHPFSKTGGLADMSAGLAKALGRAGHQVRVVTPLYRGILQRFPEIRREDWRFDLPLGAGRIQAGLYSIQLRDNLVVSFVEQAFFYDRNGYYMDHNADYPDNDARFIFFSKCVAHLARYLPAAPEIVHVHDWQAALVPALISHEKRAGWGRGERPPATCLTIHNLAYQGMFPGTSFGLTDLPREYFTPDRLEFFGLLNCLKAGIVFADAITTVSPRYAREILTEEYGCSLDGILRKRAARLRGILNGADDEDWNPGTDAYLERHFTASRPAGKTANKLALQREMGLAQENGIPLFATISRLAGQKGMDIQLAALEEMLNANMQFVLLGAGENAFEHGYRALSARFPGKAAIRFGYNEALAHRIEAGCDFYIMPSRFEPSGLNQMYSLRYGAIPIVRATGGLDDSVVDLTEDGRRANGIKFYDYSPRPLAKAIRKALALYECPGLLAQYRRNAMKADFSWNRTIREYLEVYETAKNAASRP